MTYLSNNPPITKEAPMRDVSMEWALLYRTMFDIVAESSDRKDVTIAELEATILEQRREIKALKKKYSTL